jgi:uncharacterized BrkB/YihY/UPF0761 family membrane protein
VSGGYEERARQASGQSMSERKHIRKKPTRRSLLATFGRFLVLIVIVVVVVVLPRLFATIAKLQTGECTR